MAPAFEAPRLVDILPDANSYEVSSWEEDEDPLALCATKLTGAGKVLLDPALPAVFTFGLLAAAPNTEFQSGQAVIDHLRMRKTDAELEIMRQAMHITLSVQQNHLRVAARGDWVRRNRIPHRRTASRARGGWRFHLCIVGFGEASAVPHGVDMCRSYRMVRWCWSTRLYTARLSCRSHQDVCVRRADTAAA